MLTPILYRSPPIAYYSFHIFLLFITLLETNVWTVNICVEIMYACWYPLFLEDICSWKSCSLLGFAIIVMLGLSLVLEIHVQEKVLIAFVILHYIYLLIPCVHAWIMIGEPTRVTAYEGRKQRILQV